MKKLLTYSLLAICACCTTSCGEYQRVMKTNDVGMKFDYAKRLYQEEKYAQAASVLQDLVSYFRGTERAEETLYMLGLCHYNTKDYLSSGTYLETYFRRYPRGKYAEDARYYAGYGSFLDSPDVQLDQSQTIKAIEELGDFIELYPQSPRVADARNAMFEMQDKLALKQLQNAQLYYNLGTYGGNNYNAATITAKNALKNYPYTKYREEFELLILKARFQEAENSVYEKKNERYNAVIDEYYSFINNYPESKNRREADNIFKIASRHKI